MQLSEIRSLRLHNQGILAPKYKRPEQVVAHLCAMQSQVYTMAKWAVGLRMKSAVEADVENAFQSGKILRTHLLRPTWHFVARKDIRWLLKLTAPQIQKQNASMYRKAELDADILTASCRIFENSLANGVQLTRNQLADKLLEKGVTASGHRLAYIIMNAELEGVICSGARIGKQFTYALLDDRAPHSHAFHREEAIVRLADRYFASRGPATVHDFSYWSGLSVKDARMGAASLDAKFVKTVVDGSEYIFTPPQVDIVLNEKSTFLLPDYDEYGMSYKNRDALSPKREPLQAHSDYSHWLIVRGRIEGIWNLPTAKNANVAISPNFPLTDYEQQEVEQALKRYYSFWA